MALDYLDQQKDTLYILYLFYRTFTLHVDVFGVRSTIRKDWGLMGHRHINIIRFSVRLCNSHLPS